MSVILLLNMLISNMKKLKKDNFKKKFVGKFVFHETKEVNAVCCNYEPLHSRSRKRSEYFIVGF